MTQDRFESIKKNEHGLRKEFKERTYSYLTAAFGLVAGLAWNEAIKSLIDYWLPLQSGSGGIVVKFIYAVAVTVLVVIFTFYAGKLFEERPQ